MSVNFTVLTLQSLIFGLEEASSSQRPNQLERIDKALVILAQVLPDAALKLQSRFNTYSKTFDNQDLSSLKESIQEVYNQVFNLSSSLVLTVPPTETPEETLLYDAQELRCEAEYPELLATLRQCMQEVEKGTWGERALLEKEMSSPLWIEKVPALLFFDLFWSQKDSVLPPKEQKRIKHLQELIQKHQLDAKMAGPIGQWLFEENSNSLTNGQMLVIKEMQAFAKELCSKALFKSSSFPQLSSDFSISLRLANQEPIPTQEIADLAEMAISCNLAFNGEDLLNILSSRHVPSSIYAPLLACAIAAKQELWVQFILKKTSFDSLIEDDEVASMIFFKGEAALIQKYRQIQPDWSPLCLMAAIAGGYAINLQNENLPYPFFFHQYLKTAILYHQSSSLKELLFTSALQQLNFFDIQRTLESLLYNIDSDCLSLIASSPLIHYFSESMIQSMYDEALRRGNLPLLSLFFQNSSLRGSLPLSVEEENLLSQGHLAPVRPENLRYALGYLAASGKTETLKNLLRLPIVEQVQSQEAGDILCLALNQPSSEWLALIIEAIQPETAVLESALLKSGYQSSFEVLETLESAEYSIDWSQTLKHAMIGKNVSLAIEILNKRAQHLEAKDALEMATEALHLGLDELSSKLLKSIKGDSFDHQDESLKKASTRLFRCAQALGQQDICYFLFQGFPLNLDEPYSFSSHILFKE